MNTTNLLIIASDYKPNHGGRADYIDNLARGLLKLGIKTKVLAVVQSQQQQRIKFLKNYEPWVIPFEVTHDKRPRNRVGNKVVSVLEIVRCLSPRSRRLLERMFFFNASSNAVTRLARVLKEENPTLVVFGHLDMRLYPFALHLLERKLPYGLIVHGCEVPRRPNRKNDFIRRETVLAGAKWLVANSSYSKSLLDVWGFPKDRVKVVNPPIAEEAIRYSATLGPIPKRTDRLNLVTLCRLVKGKAIDVVLRALKILIARSIPFQYVIGGEGSERAYLEALTDELKLRSNVHFTGYITGDEKWRILRGGDVFVMPSRIESAGTESFGIAFVEAAAFGLPTIGSRVGGIPDAIIDGKTGILVPRDKPEDLADALTFLYRNPERRLEMGKAGMDRAMVQFSPTAIAAHFQQEILEYA